VIRSDASEAHRLSLSARFLSARDNQVKAKRHKMKHFRRFPHEADQDGRGSTVHGAIELSTSEKTCREMVQ